MADKLFTWADVDARLAQSAADGRWPAWLMEADAWWDGLELFVHPDTTRAEVREWLDGLFGLGSVSEEEGVLELALDRPSSHHPAALEVRLIEESRRTRVARRPRLGERRIVRELGELLPRPESDELPGGRQMIAFHSFKGGVGRTLHAVALADHLAQRGQHVLLVDADLEAPGITWMYQAQRGRCDIAYEDLLALLHSAQEGDATEAVGIAAAYLPNQRVSRYPGTGCVTVLPAGRRARFGPPRIAPADLLTEDRSPYFLSESLAQLAVAAEADTVVLDLRAGASELAAPILLDPRVMRVFVTTISSQSLHGTEKLIRQLGSQSPARAGVDPAPGAVITQYRPDVHDGHAEQARARLSDALSSMLTVPPEAADGAADPDDLAVDEQVLTEPVLSRFREELLALPESWDAVVEVVRRCGLPDLLEEFAPGTLLAGGCEEEPETLDDRRRGLERSADRLVYAEQRGMDVGLTFLTTEPVRRLIADHSTDLPVAVVVGAKGSGKTFTFARLCAQKTWQAFATENGQHVRRQARVVPVLDPANMSEPRPGVPSPQELRDAAADGHGITADEIRTHLNAGLRHERAEDEEFWRSRWLECLARAAGAAEGEPAEAFLINVNQKREGTLFVVDGLEDWLETVDSEAKRIALRVLLREVPDWLRRLRSRSLGLVVFVRQDLVRAAIRQNLGQFLYRYSPYELRWDTEDALRLSLWVAVNAGAVSAPDTPIADMGFEEIVRSLLPLWGAKLGTDSSREAWTERWVPAALGDFKKQIQARDVVRFLCEAAKASVGDSRWTDRVLTPAAMRKALGECSRAKVEEINQENPRLGKLFKEMESFSEKVKMPFEASAVGLKSDDVEALEEWGALARDADGRYRMPEIYRHALGFRTQGRARVVKGL